MYPVQQNSKGYSFVTDAGVTYLVYFTLLEDYEKYIPKNILIDNYFYFGIERTSAKVGCIDRFIKDTVAGIIVRFFLQNETSVLIFNYNDDGRMQARRRLFYSWFERFSTHTTYQLYQHDFLDCCSVCALCKRTGGKEFDKLRKNIQDSLANFEGTTKS